MLFGTGFENSFDIIDFLHLFTNKGDFEFVVGNAFGVELIHTVRGVGYVLREA